MAIFRMPPAEHQARRLLGQDLELAAGVLDRDNLHRMPKLDEALREARQTLADMPSISKVNTICLRESDDVRLLITVSRKGWEIVWSFGNGRT